MHIGIAFTGDAADPTARSGTPFGVLNGVREQGHQAVALKATPGRRPDQIVAGLDALAHVVTDRIAARDRVNFREAYKGAHLGKGTSIVRTRALQWRSRNRPLDLIIALGSGYETEPSTPYVIYDDMTVAQAIHAGYPEWKAMRSSDRQFRLEQQRRRYLAASRCCMTTTWAAQSAIEDFGVPKDRVVVVGAGTHEWRREVQRSWSAPRFLFVGLNWERKNGERVLAAFDRVKARHSDATLDVVGGHPPIQANGVTTWGRLSRTHPTERSTLQNLYDRATCFVMPSIHEPGGVVFLEAASVGVGAVGGNSGGSADFIGDAGIIVDPTDLKQIEDAMDQFCSPEFAASRGSMAFERSARFAWSQVAGRILIAAGVDAPGTSSLFPVV